MLDDEIDAEISAVFGTHLDNPFPHILIELREITTGPATGKWESTIITSGAFEPRRIRSAPQPSIGEAVQEALETYYDAELPFPQNHMEPMAERYWRLAEQTARMVMAGECLAGEQTTHDSRPKQGAPKVFEHLRASLRAAVELQACMSEIVKAPNAADMQTHPFWGLATATAVFAMHHCKLIADEMGFPDLLACDDLGLNLSVKFDLGDDLWEIDMFLDWIADEASRTKALLSQHQAIAARAPSEASLRNRLAALRIVAIVDGWAGEQPVRGGRTF